MAYEYKPLQQRPEDERQLQAPGTPMPIAAPGFTGSLAPPGAPGAPNTPQNTGSKFVNFDRILNANKDVANRSVQNLENRIENQVGQSEGRADALTGQLKTKIAAATPAWATGIANGGTAAVNRVGLTGRDGGTMGTSTTQQGLQGESYSPEVMAGRLDVEAGDAATRANTVYGGPRGMEELEGWGDFVRGVNQTREQLASTGSSQGLVALSRNTSPGVTDGGARMNAALMGSVGQEKFAGLRDKWSKLGDLIDNNAKLGAARGEEGRRVVEGAAGAYRGALDEHDAAVTRDQVDRDVATAARQDEEKYYTDNRAEWEEFKARGPQVGVAGMNSGGFGGVLPDNYKEAAWDLQHGPGSWKRMMELDAKVKNPGGNGNRP